MADTTSEFKKHTQGVPRIRAVERTVKLLGLFSAEKPHLSLAELSRGLGTSKGTTHRYAASLVDAGILIYDSNSNTYSLSIHVLSFAAAAVVDLSVVKVANKHLKKLAEQVDETVVLGMWDEASNGPIITDFEYGASMGIRATIGFKLGKETAHWKLYNAYRQSGSDVEGTDPNVDPEIAEIRETGLAMITPGGYWVLVAPIFDGDQIFASMGIIGAGDNIAPHKKTSYYENLKATANELSEEITMILRVSKAK